MLVQWPIFRSILTKGISLTVEGDCNDYVGKGLSGGKIIETSSKVN